MFRLDNDNLRAIILMIAASSAFAMKDGFVKSFGGLYPITEILSAQYTFQFLLFLPLLLIRYGPSKIFPKKLFLQFLRGIAAIIAVAFFYYSISNIPLADATALVFISPLVITALTPMTFGDKVGVRRWCAVIIGFCGILLIIKPGFEEINTGTFAAVAAGIIYAFFQIITRKLSDEEVPLVTAFFTSAIGCVIANLFLLNNFIIPSPVDGIMFAGIGLLVAVGQLSLILSLATAPPVVVAPFGYSTIIVAIAIGYFVFGDIPDLIAMTGIIILVLTGIYIAIRESKSEQIRARIQ